MLTAFVLIGALWSGVPRATDAGTGGAVQPIEGDVVVKGFRFRSGEGLTELRLHYTTLGTPRRDASGRVVNAVLIMHGTTGQGRRFADNPRFAGVLFGPGQPLDASRYYLILPDAIGHGRSSKPSDGLRGRFPHYDYRDMVEAEVLLAHRLGVDHLRLFLGTSMGCMHAFILAEEHPDFMDAAMPVACSVVEIAGQNRMFRKTVIDALRNDPGYLDGEYREQPRALQTVAAMLTIEYNGSVQLQLSDPTREAADADLTRSAGSRLKSLDANDVIYAFDASRDYDPLPGLERIKAAVTWVNSADDRVDPPELAIPEREIKRIPRGRFVLLPIRPGMNGHLTHSLPEFWKDELVRLLKDTEH